jgi:hypothetical protein
MNPGYQSVMNFARVEQKDHTRPVKVFSGFGSGFVLHRFNDQDRNRSPMPNFMRSAAKNKIAQQSMTMTGHGDQIALLRLGSFEQFGRRIAHGQMSTYR